MKYDTIMSFSLVVCVCESSETRQDENSINRNDSAFIFIRTRPLSKQTTATNVTITTMRRMQVFSSSENAKRAEKCNTKIEEKRTDKERGNRTIDIFPDDKAHGKTNKVKEIKQSQRMFINGFSVCVHSRMSQRMTFTGNDVGIDLLFGRHFIIIMSSRLGSHFTLV